MLVGGGSGGHITPLLSIAKQLRLVQSDVVISVVSEKKGKCWPMIRANNAHFNTIYTISAGKYRRYHGQSVAKSILDVKTNLLNIRDFFKFLVGLAQSVKLLIMEKPDVIFIKGGFVGVPVGLAANMFDIPYITHDSDALAGLANRIIGKGAKINTVGMPAENYNYAKEKTDFVGVPIDDTFRPVSKSQQLKAKKQLGFSNSDNILLVTGGSNGAQRLDVSVRSIAQKLLENNQHLRIVHQIGAGNQHLYDDLPDGLKNKVEVKSFINNLSTYSAASDVIITRGGATAITEYATQKKPCLIVPSPFLSGGHQLINVKALEKADAAVVANEEDAAQTASFYKVVSSLLNDKNQQKRIADNLHRLIPSDATAKICKLLLQYAKGPGNK